MADRNTITVQINRNKIREEKVTQNSGGVGTEKTGRFAKMKSKDSVFTDLFQDPGNTLQLYKVLHPEDVGITVNQLQNVTLKNILVNKPYNDLGFLVGSKLIVLVEQQSTWSENILFRLLFYLADTLQRYFFRTKQSLYAARKVNCPEIEMYVLYTGSRKKRPRTLELASTFYRGRRKNVNLRVYMLYGGRQEGDILDQYVMFTRIFNEQVRRYGRSQKTVAETIRLCQEQDVLNEYLENRKKEVAEIMISILDEEYNNRLLAEKKAEAAEKKAKKTTARNLYTMGIPLETIAAAVEVDIDTVKKWLTDKRNLHSGMKQV